MKKISLLSILAALLIMGCSQKKDTSASVDEKKSKPLVDVQVIEKKPMPNIVEYTGNVEAFVKNMISSQSAMRIQKIYVEVGDRVTKGQLLVQMEAANFAQSNAQLQNLKTDYTRMEALYKTGGVSKQQLDQMKTQLDVAAEATKSLDENTKLVSPISGIVTQRNFDDGDLTGGQPILIVQQISPVKVLVNVAEEYYPKVKTGMGVNIKLDIYPNEIFKGKVSLIYPTIDPMSKTFTVQITVENSNTKVRPGMFARANIDFGQKDYILVPDLAVQKQSGSNERYVFVYKDGKVSRRTIELGRRFENVFEVLSGLEEGEQVVTAGQARLLDQMEVELQK